MGSSFRLYLDVKNSGYPNEYRVLFHNCNLKYRDHSKCANRINSIKKQIIKPSTDKKKINISYIKLKKETINNYGGKCECCHINDIDVLSIDHIYGGGKAHCKELGGGGGAILYNWLKKNGYPKDKFRVLCMNCNRSHGSYGYCPHKKEINEN